MSPMEQCAAAQAAGYKVHDEYWAEARAACRRTPDGRSGLDRGRAELTAARLWDWTLRSAPAIRRHAEAQPGGAAIWAAHEAESVARSANRTAERDKLAAESWAAAGGR